MTTSFWREPGREAAGYLGMSLKMLEEVYGHHHPDHQKSIKTAFTRTTPTNRIRNVSF